MNIIDIMKFMGEQGLFYKESELDQTLSYLERMLTDGRIIKVDKEGLTYAIIIYSITDNTDEFLKKGTWEYKPQDPFGATVYIEKIVSRGWDRQLRTLFEHLIRTKFPQIEYGVWHRYGKYGDRKTWTKRRLQNV